MSIKQGKQNIKSNQIFNTLFININKENNLIMLQSQKIRNPFALLDQANEIPNIQTKTIEKQKGQYQPIKKQGNLPFSKFQIKHEQKQSKPQTNRNQEVKQKQKNTQNTSKKQANKISSTGSVSTQVKVKQQQTKADSKQSKQKVETPEISKNESFTQSQYTDDDEQKKYFLTKKHRQVRYQLNADGDPPLLYDIGLEPEMIKDKLRLVLKMGEPDYDMIMNPDLAGPVAIAFAFGFSLLFSGQIHFGDIYALFIMGNLLLFFLFNFMARREVISLYNIMSILGYCLLPMLVLGVAGIFVRLNTGFGLIFSLLISLWSSVAGGNFIQALLKGKKNRKLLIVYPLFLFYACFAMIVIF